MSDDMDHWADADAESLWRDGEEDELAVYQDCGRWINGELMPVGLCLKAGSEDCDWDCPLNGDNSE